ncbi:MAG: hypothetical protein M1832_001904 [Thelocarpon impressellum]|nr:MAG: hypothetical protein M1832_001904 [Thelocarpon impressellum]
MPHKHRRDRSKDASAFELPPTSVARPLPVSRATKPSSKKSKPKKTVSKDGFAEGDTPRAFARLMRFQAGTRRPSGLDDGVPSKKTKKRKRGDDTEPTPTTIPDPPEGEVPRIRPGERMSEFSARVDAALPVSGLIGKPRSGGDPAGVKVKHTKHTKRLQRMQAQWREEEKKRKEAIEVEELDDEGDGVGFPTTETKAKKDKKKRKQQDAPPPTKATTSRGIVGLHDVVQAPPSLTVPRAILKASNPLTVPDVPRAAGSLRKREELGRARRDVLSAYRARMEGRRRGDS